MTLEQIRCNIEKDSVGMLYSDEMFETMEAIKAFKASHHYLPNDISEWHDMVQEWIEEQQAELDEQMEMEDEIREEYQAYVWEQYLKD